MIADAKKHGKNDWIIPCLFFAREHFLSPQVKTMEVVNTANTQWVERHPHQFRMLLFSTLRRFVCMTNTTVDKNKHILNVCIICSVNRWPSSAALTEISNVSKSNTQPRLVHLRHSLLCLVLVVTAASCAGFDYCTAKMNSRCTLIYVAIYRYWSESMALFWRCWYWGNNDNRAKKTAIDGRVSEAIPLEICCSSLGTMLFVDSLVL